MSDSPPPERSKGKLITGISLLVIGIIEITSKSPVNLALGGGGHEDPVSHLQGVIGGSLLLIMGTMFLYSYFKKR
jgi:hypothetical protein